MEEQKDPITLEKILLALLIIFVSFFGIVAAVNFFYLILGDSSACIVCL